MGRLLTILLSIAASVAVAGVVIAMRPAAPLADTQPAFTQVMQTSTLRCAYITLPPTFSKDPNTGAYSGIAYDLTEKMAKSLHLKVDWVEEVNFSNLAEGLKTHRYDAVCFPLYLGNVAMARAVDYTIPIFYTGTGIVVRADDHRFDRDWAAINSPDVTVATIDGEASQFIRAEQFPRTKDYSMPQNTEIAQVVEAVADHKADVTFFDQSNFSSYLTASGKNAPVRDIAIGRPLRIHAHSFVVNKGETKLASTLDSALSEMEYAGQTEAILKKYQTLPGALLRVAAPYAPLH
ncbi:MAG: transporter substrate-binding domain-containing protein [Alphaproteobacteria bacterium]|nr:transporter substrate-binding domain-containing protein [Alphaproteobacteria bacterium]